MDREGTSKGCLHASFQEGALKFVFAEPRKGAVEGRDEQSLGSLRSHLRHQFGFHLCKQRSL